ncbi:unnamed protein product, partial [Acanthoscelides obtectus]
RPDALKSVASGAPRAVQTPTPKFINNHRPSHLINTCVVPCTDSCELQLYLSEMMSTTSLSSVVLLVLTAAMSLVAAYKVQHDSNRLFDEEKRASSLDRSSLVPPLLSSAVDSPDYQLGVRYDEYPVS